MSVQDGSGNKLIFYRDLRASRPGAAAGDHGQSGATRPSEPVET